MAASLTGTREPAAPSKWLHEALSDVERKVSTITANLEGGHDDFANGKSDDIVSARKDEIIRLLDEMIRSYTSLAQDHDHLMTEFDHFRNLSDEKQGSNDSNPYPDAGSDLSPVSGIEDLELDDFDVSLPCKPIDESSSFLGLTSSQGEIEEEGWRWDNMTAQMTELLEESAKQQEELARRNEEKREIIRVLRTEVSGLKAENKALQGCLIGPRVGSEEIRRRVNRKLSLKELVWNKLFRREAA
ncbi:hypothetical protein MLD38_000095 [Melastoma candidum]|uniref:Uncharacterized protein n=1 Tax=Melastoma candidum TaxID=119954 RepID=A0ACB9SHL1_9MYRT|nr:hypothetical protein MLD38_000095 [Melastoma candidum]